MLAGVVQHNGRTHVREAFETRCSAVGTIIMLYLVVRLLLRSHHPAAALTWPEKGNTRRDEKGFLILSSHTQDMSHCTAIAMMMMGNAIFM